LPTEEHENRKRAVALRYDEAKEQAPRVVATGGGYLAEHIIEVAQQNGVYIQDDPDLVALLAKLDLNTEIPADLFKAVAEVLAFVYRLNQTMDAPQ
jgi:flagellar biosynthesis protein